MMGGMGMGYGILGMILMLLFWILLILSAVWITKALFGNIQPHPRKDSSQTPCEILDQRYGRGEITREQYEIMKQDIG